MDRRIPLMGDSNEHALAQVARTNIDLLGSGVAILAMML
jgi:hypothetical protein